VSGIYVQALSWGGGGGSDFKKVRLEIAARDMLPESINFGYERAGLPARAETNKDIWMFSEVDWPAVPRVGEDVTSGLRIPTR
jgi:hypothetical protein